MVDGAREELELEILVTQRPAGQQVALIVKQAAERIGIKVNIVTRDNSSFGQAIRQREFELLPIQVRTSPALNDPYQNWHSASDAPGGNNRTGFRNDEADEVIARIRSAESTDERNQYYFELQEILHEEVPTIFLYVPLERIIVNNEIGMQPSSRRPGYFENLFQ